MHASRRLLLQAGLALLVAGCAGRHPSVEARLGPGIPRPAQVLLAPAVLLDAGQLQLAPDGAEIYSRPFQADQVEGGGTPAEGSPGRALLDAFYANLFVGRIWHSGGYELLPELGNQVRSLGLGFSKQAEYARQAQEWADSSLGEALTARGLSWTRLPESVEAALRAPTRRSVRGSGPLDGEDNQNLPRVELEPQALDPAALPASVGQAGADALLVPIIVHYYAHNGGWFVGQAQGCPAGARLRLLWVLHDPKTGAVRTWADLSARYVEPYFYTPNDVQMQDYLLAVEAQLRVLLAEDLLR